MIGRLPGSYDFFGSSEFIEAFRPFRPFLGPFLLRQQPCLEGTPSPGSWLDWQAVSFSPSNFGLCFDWFGPPKSGI